MEREENKGPVCTWLAQKLEYESAKLRSLQPAPRVIRKPLCGQRLKLDSHQRCRVTLSGVCAGQANK